MDKSKLYQAQRQSILGTLFIFLRSWGLFLKAFWPLLLLYVFKGDISNLFHGYWRIIGVVVFFAFVVNAFLLWRNFYFYVKDNQLILEQGYLRKRTTSIPFDRIVSVNIKQGVVHQLLDIVQVEVDSAGSKTKEIQIKALSRQTAELLQQELASGYKSEDITDTKTKKSDTILHLGILDLLRVGIAQNHLKAFLLLLAFGYNIYQELQNIFDKELENMSTKAAGYLDNSDIYFQLFFVAFLLLFGMLFSIVRVIFQYFNLTIKQEQKTFTIKQGLLTQKQVTIPFAKVQVVKSSTNPIQQRLGISTVQIVQINSSMVQSEKEKVIIDGCNHEKYLRFCNTVFDNPFQSDFEIIHPHQRFTLRNFIVIFNILAVIVLMGSYFNIWLSVLFPIAFLLAFLFAKLLTKRRSYAIGKEYLYINGGMIAKTQAVTQIEKIQAIRVTQTFFQRRNGVASLKIHVAGDILNINYIDKETAIAIKDNLLYRCEKS